MEILILTGSGVLHKGYAADGSGAYMSNEACNLDQVKEKRIFPELSRLPDEMQFKRAHEMAKRECQRCFRAG